MHRRTILHSLAGFFVGTRTALAQNGSAPTVDVSMFGAVGDGTTDDSAAFRAAQEFVSSQGGGTIRVPHTAQGYRIGAGTRGGRGAQQSGIVVGSNTRWIGDGGVQLIAGSHTSRGNYIFQISDVQDVEITGFSSNGQALTRGDQPYVFASMSGVVARIRLNRLALDNFANFALQYADVSTDPAMARFEDVTIDHVRVGGVTGVTGAGAGINFFPRAQLPGGAPASRGLVLDTLDLDVTNGSDDTRRHGPQGLKINNVDGITARAIRCKGGNVAAAIISNGCRNVEIEGQSSASRIGLTVDTYNNTATSRTGGVTVRGWSHDRGSVTTSKVDGIRLKGALKGVSVLSARLSGADFRIADNYENDRATGDATPTGWFIGRVEMQDGNFVSEAPSVPGQPPLDGLRIDSLSLTGRAGARTGRVALGGWPLRGAQIGSVVLRGVDGHGLTLGGSGNLVESLDIVDGNPSRAAKAWAFIDSGIGNTIRHIRLSGAGNGMTHFANISSEGAGTTISAVSGTPRSAEGLRIANQQDGPALGGALRVESEEFELSAPGRIQYRFLADRDYWIASLELLHLEDTGYGPGAVVSVGTGEDPMAYASFRSMTGARAGQTALRQNTIGKMSFTSRRLRQGATLSFGCEGGRGGRGRVRLFANLIPAE